MEDKKSNRPPRNDSKGRVAFVAVTGHRHHLGDCSYLRKSKQAIRLTRAIAIGYTPCSRCKPRVRDRKK
jgi:hypothetical protein